MDLTQVAASSPFSQSLLCSDDCFVLDNGASGKVYVWKGAWGWGHMGTGAIPGVALTFLSIGRKANEQERQAALRVAEEVIARMGHSPRTQVGAAVRGARAGTGSITTSLSPPCPCRWKSCPRAMRRRSSSNSSPAGSEGTEAHGVSAQPAASQGWYPCASSMPLPVHIPCPSSTLCPSHPCTIPIPLPAGHAIPFPIPTAFQACALSMVTLCQHKLPTITAAAPPPPSCPQHHPALCIPVPITPCPCCPHALAVTIPLHLSCSAPKPQ